MINYTEAFKVTGGLIRGIDLGNGIAAFKGIPYAAPPVGELRFKAPVPPSSWEEVLDCAEFGHSPVQNDVGFNDLWTEEFLIRNRDFSEDCLTLNLWADLDKSEKKPVIIYFYGGGFVSGGSSCDIYDGSEIAKNGAIFVTFNHREGTLGLFSSPELSEESPNGTSGNYLLMDDIAAIKWVRDNINVFGGDPENITIMGQSSGASEVNALTVSPLAKGLFRQSMSMSFNNYNEFARPFFSKEKGYAAGESLLKNAGKTLEDIKNQPAMDFLKDDTIRNLTLDGYVLDMKFKDAVNEGRTSDTVTIMGAVPGDNLMSGLFSDLWMTGVAITEKSQIISGMKDFFKEDYDKAAVIYDVDNRDFKTIKRELDNDFLISSMLYFVDGRKKAGAEAPAYIYYYIHPMPGPKALQYGAFHSCEVPYFTKVFSDLRKEYWQDEDYALGERLCKGLVDFARDNKPSNSDFLPSDGRNYFRIDAKESRNCVFDEEKRKIWFEGFKNSPRG